MNVPILPRPAAPLPAPLSGSDHDQAKPPASTPPGSAPADAGASPSRFLRRLRRRDARASKGQLNLRKALFILPNAFTVASIFCGVYSILRSSSGSSPEDYYYAAIALIYAAFFDAFDGRVARLTKTQSEFGVQIDSLADVISFGVAPSILVYYWALEPFAHIGMLAACVYCACGAIRLARFNVLAARGHGSSAYFVGLPIPGAAITLVSLIVAQFVWLHESVTARASVLALVLVLSYLMVSRVRFRTFKDFRPSKKSAPLLVLLLGVLVILVAVWKAAMAFVFVVAAYIATGLLEEVIFYRKRQELAK